MKRKCTKCGKDALDGVPFLCDQCTCKHYSRNIQPKQEPIEELPVRKAMPIDGNNTYNTIDIQIEEITQKLNEIIKLINNLCQKKSQ